MIGEFSDGLGDVELSLVVERCFDGVLTIRKQGIECLTKLLAAHPKSPSIVNAWIHSVLPLVNDPEATVQEKVLNCFEDHILQSIASSVK